MSTPSGFDAFFQKLSTGYTPHPEISGRSRDDNKKDIGSGTSTVSTPDLDIDTLIQSLQDIEKINQKFETVHTSLQAHTEDTQVSPIEKKGDISANQVDTKTPEKPDIEIVYPVVKNPLTYGFLGIAGMEDLKGELQSSFIAPLKFKFLVENMRKTPPQPPSKADGNAVGVDIEITTSSSGENGVHTDATATYERLYTLYEQFKVGIPTGLLFYGPPGTGKTFITKKLAEELKCGIIIKNIGEFGSSYMHETSGNIRKFFAAAKAASVSAPIILFLDEIDSLVSARTDRVDANKAEEISQFLQEFNALSEAPNLIVVAATNRPDHLDPAILRSGRLDKKYYIGPPDISAREMLFKMYIEKEGRPHKKLDYVRLATLTDGYVASDIEAICDEVSRDASADILDMVAGITSGDIDVSHIEHAEKHTKIDMKGLEKAIADTVSSLKMVDMSIYDKWLEKIEGK